ncbi:protein GRIP isoform X1 [Typha angustifolia]|uniref:protein GRIP isoform X1 n=2 Tax=Typha angustifolia TaxID=59011 RepID=UPI003C2E9AC2
MATEEDTSLVSQDKKSDETPEVHKEDAAKMFEKVNISMENGDRDNLASPDEDHDQLMAMELILQNEYLKSQLGDLLSEHVRSKGVPVKGSEIRREEEASELVNNLYEQIKNLNEKIQEQKETQKAAEAALEHLRIAYSDADGKVQELSVKLVEAQHKMEQEIKERDDKYVELDSKFGRLHKRAKQRIQELQKEKDDLEARFNDVNGKVEQASSQQVLAQQELDRTRQQANEALRSMDVERQQLRAANNKLRDSIDEMRRSLEAKENALEGLQKSILEKEQMLEQIQSSFQSADEKRQASIMELSAKHQKQLESLESQLADALAERSKATETISSLQMLLAEKDSEIAEIDAVSTGEAVRLGAAMEELKAELVHLKDQNEKERQNWEAACQALRGKLEASENACLRSEIESAKIRSQLELEISAQNQLLHTRDAELLAAKDEIEHLEGEFSAYKIRAHALLQKKDAELSAAKNSDIVKAQEEALKEAEKEVAAALAERNKAIQDLQDALSMHDKEIEARDAALADADHRLKSINMKLDSATAEYLSEKESWQKDLKKMEESWRLKYNALEAQIIAHKEDHSQHDLEKLKFQYGKLKEEHETFRDIADRMIEEKEKEIAKLIEDNKNLRHSLESRAYVDHNDKHTSASLKQDTQMLNTAAAEQQILILARQQAQREEELAQSQRHILALQEEIEELERENRLHSQQEAMLKAELRNVERSQKREGVDMTYLKNVIMKLLETGEVEALLPVVATLLQFSPEEIRKCQLAYRSSHDAPSPAASLSETGSTPQSLFSRFSF